MLLAGQSIEISLSCLHLHYRVQMFFGAGIPRAVTSVEDSNGVMQALFAPFPETTFPRTLNAASPAGLMPAPLACRVPLPQSQYQHARRLFQTCFAQKRQPLHMIFTHFWSQLCRHHGQLALLQSFFSQASGIQLGTDCLSLLLGTLAFLSAKTGQ